MRFSPARAPSGASAPIALHAGNCGNPQLRDFFWHLPSKTRIIPTRIARLLPAIRRAATDSSQHGAAGGTRTTRAPARPLARRETALAKRPRPVLKTPEGVQDGRREVRPAPQGQVPQRGQGRDAGEVPLQERHGDPQVREDRREHGRWRGCHRLQGYRRRRARPARHHRPAADDHPRPQVHRLVPPACRHADRRQGDPARRPHVGVLRPPHRGGHPPYPRLPRYLPQELRRPW